MKLNEERERELKNALMDKYRWKLKPKVLKNIVKDINKIRLGEVSVHDWLPELEGIARYGDMLVNLDVQEFLIL